MSEPQINEVTADFVSYGNFDRPPILLERTCYACPEQYDAWMNGVKIGYLRLRHGHFTVQYENPSGPEVYEAQPEDDGIFADSERKQYLAEACHALARYIAGEPPREVQS